MKKGRSLPKNIIWWHISRWRLQTLWAETMNRIKYSRVNQQTKMASVTFRKRVSSASSSSVPSWKAFKYNRSFVLLPYTKHVSCGVLESRNCWEDEEKHRGEKKEWACGHKNLEQFEIESNSQQHYTKSYQRRFGWVSILEQSPNLSSYSCTTNALEWIRLDLVYIRRQLYVQSNHLLPPESPGLTCPLMAAPKWLSAVCRHSTALNRLRHFAFYPRQISHPLMSSSYWDLTFTWCSPDHLTIIWPSPDPQQTLT